MNVSSIKLNCYVEGVKIPIKSYQSSHIRNKLSSAIIEIPIGDVFHPKQWANAFIQVTCVQNQKEKMLYEGLINSVDIADDRSLIRIGVRSLWNIFNLNTTLDYTAPKKYGINDLSGDVTIYIGNESTIETTVESDNYQISKRYFFIANAETSEIDLNTSESFKLQYIIDKTPLAERFAFNLFELIQYDNFILSKSYIDRFKLLSKVSLNSKRDELENEFATTIKNYSNYEIEVDISRTGLINRLNPTTTVVSNNTDNSNIVTLDRPVTNGLKRLAKFIQDFEGFIAPNRTNPRGSRSYRNNNPGNLEFGDFARKYGATKGDPRFAIFPNYESGFNALMGLVVRYSEQGHTLRTMMNKYAPPSENDTERYIRSLASSLGVDSNTTLKSIIGN